MGLNIDKSYATSFYGKKKSGFRLGDTQGGLLQQLLQQMQEGITQPPNPQALKQERRVARKNIIGEKDRIFRETEDRWAQTTDRILNRVESRPTTYHRVPLKHLKRFGWKIL